MDLTDRIKGCIVGGAIGDAFGSRYEGQQNPSIDLCADSLEISDDTQLTLATCEAIIESRGQIDPPAIASAFVRWFSESRITGIGASTYKALTELAVGGHWALVGNKGERAAGNGAAMRIAPLAFCSDAANPEDRRSIRDVSRITHHNEEAYVGALAVVIAVRAAFDGIWNGEEHLLQLVIDSLPDSRVKDRLIEIESVEAGMSVSEIGCRFGNSGYVVDSVPLALLGAQRVPILGFQRMILELIAGGGDTDTIASIAGQIAGTLMGRSALPDEMLAHIAELEFIEQTSNNFADCVTIGLVKLISRS